MKFFFKIQGEGNPSPPKFGFGEGGSGPPPPPPPLVANNICEYVGGGRTFGGTYGHCDLQTISTQGAELVKNLYCVHLIWPHMKWLEKKGTESVKHKNFTRWQKWGKLKEKVKRWSLGSISAPGKAVPADSPICPPFLRRPLLCKKVQNQGFHRMPLYFIPVSVRVRLARTLLKRLLSKN